MVILINMEKEFVSNLSSTGASMIVTICILFVYYKVLQTKFEDFLKRFEESFFKLQRDIEKLSKNYSDLRIKLAEEYRTKEDCKVFSENIQHSFRADLNTLKKEIHEIKRLLLEIFKKNS